MHVDEERGVWKEGNMKRGEHEKGRRGLVLGGCRERDERENERKKRM